MTLYPLLKQVHVTCVLIAVTGFVLRGTWMLRGSPLLDHRLTRILPHINDTLLLGSALSMLWVGQIWPPEQPWILAKICALLAYIVFGSLALRRGQTPSIRTTAFGAAVLTLAYILSVALSRDPMPF